MKILFVTDLYPIGEENIAKAKGYNNICVYDFI